MLINACDSNPCQNGATCTVCTCVMSVFLFDDSVQRNKPNERLYNYHYFYKCRVLFVHILVSAHLVILDRTVTLTLMIVPQILAKMEEAVRYVVLLMLAIAMPKFVTKHFFN